MIVVSTVSDPYDVRDAEDAYVEALMRKHNIKPITLSMCSLWHSALPIVVRPYTGSSECNADDRPNDDRSGYVTPKSQARVEPLRTKSSDRDSPDEAEDTRSTRSTYSVKSAKSGQQAELDFCLLVRVGVLKLARTVCNRSWQASTKPAQPG